MADPWGLPARARRRTIGPLPRAAAAVAIATIGPTRLFWAQSGPQRQGAVVLLVAVVALAVGLLPGRARLARLAGSSAVAVIGVAAVHATIGVRSLVAALVVVAVVGAALGAWEKPSHLRSGLAVAMAALGMGAWHRTGQPNWAIAGAAAGALLVVAMDRWPAASAADHSVRRAIVRVVAGIAHAVLFVVTAVLLYLPGVIARAGRRFVRRRDGWRPTEADAATDRRVASEPFGATAPRVRRQRLGVGALVIVALVGGLVAWRRAQPPERVIVSVPPAGSTTAAPSTPPGMSGAVRYSQTAAGAGLPWADRVQREQLALPLPPDPVTGFSVGDYRTRYTNVRDGARKTVEPTTSDAPTVWLVGGSAAFGIGQRDDHSLASELVRQGDAAGHPMRVVSLGVPGYSLWQEYQLVLARLASGGERPDLVLFYDGFNDLIQSFVPAITVGTTWDRPAMYDPAAMKRFRSMETDEVQAQMRALGGPEELGRQIARRYVRLQDLVRSQLEAEGIPTAFAFQPDATASPANLARVERRYALPVLRSDSVDLFASTARSTVSALPSQVIDLHDLFADTDAPVFIDLVHTNEVGAQRVAKALVPRIAPQLEPAR
ncbi:MAG: hypothetical protein U0P45_02095 [Acidimicrobiales bacterium]